MYESFASVYDALMDDVPYEEWCDHLCRILSENGMEDGLILDLGCGTGSMTRALRRRGYDMIGIDSSVEMLELAREKSLEDPSILYLLQDMRSFELYGTVRAIVSVCDCMNYLLDEEELFEVFKLADNYLDPGGLFLFDMNTPFKYREILGDATFAENRDGVSYIWENTWYEEEKINEYDLTLFLKKDQDTYRRFDEVHVQKGYEPETVTALLERAGLKVESVTDAYTGRPLSEESERVLFAAREQKKRG